MAKKKNRSTVRGLCSQICRLTANPVFKALAKKPKPVIKKKKGSGKRKKAAVGKKKGKTGARKRKSTKKSVVSSTLTSGAA